MKKVRFETPEKPHTRKMNDSECHSPRPFIEREVRTMPPLLMQEYPRILTYSSDPIQRYESSNSSPYPMINRTSVPSFSEKEASWKPSDDLNLSLLDASGHEPRQAGFCKSILKEADVNKLHNVHIVSNTNKQTPLTHDSDTNSNIKNPPNVLVKDNSFFIRRDNLDKYHFNLNPIQTHLSGLSIGKENDPLFKKAEMLKTDINNVPWNEAKYTKPFVPVCPTLNNECMCHHCFKKENVSNFQTVNSERKINSHKSRENIIHSCVCSTPKNRVCSHCEHVPPPPLQPICKTCTCHVLEASPQSSPAPQNAVDRKIWAIEKYEQSKQSNGMEVEKQTNITKEKREPTVADLFKIIKLQNEQLQLLQEKVDKFISSSKQTAHPTITCSTEHIAVNTVENDQHKMSIGVMTSFEMVRTSVINKEIVKQTNDNAQIQCNRSQISIKEVVSKPVNMNFLDGIVNKNMPQTVPQDEQKKDATNGQQTDNCDEKTLNELSLYNVQVDNATTPLMSPEQTLYLDVRDYSESDASSTNHSNVGWTYYNKVMTHVNGMLQDSEMPSSASAMYRNMRQQCVQMHIDKTNVSVTKRVKFGDEPARPHQPHIFTAPSSDTSLKMNQLAAKYLKNLPTQVVQRTAPATAAPIDMSFATRNYMEKHRLLHGLPATSKSPQAGEIPRFLDITALKQQPKFL